MSNMIPLDLLVDVTSTGVRDTFTVNKLPTILMVKTNPLLPNKEFQEVLTATSAKSYFGSTSYVADFADTYFGVISKKATKPDRLWVYNFAETGQAEVIKGAKVTSAVMTLNGDFGIKLGSTTENFTVNLVGAISYSAVATLIQTEIRTSTNIALSGATVAFSAITGGFILTLSDLATYNASIVAGTANDIHSQLGLTVAEGATFIPLITAKTFEEALSAIDTNNGNYYVIATGFDLTIDVDTDELAELGTFVHGSNDRFMAVYSWSNAQIFTSDSGVMTKYEGYNGLFIDTKQDTTTNAFICGLISAMNLSIVAGNYNLAWNDASIFADVAITDGEQYNAMKVNKANAPSKFGILGQDDTIYMNGTILGSKTDSANIYMCNSFLKFAIQIALYNMSKAQDIISLRGTRGIGFVTSYLNEVFNSAVNANIIVRGATLTTTEKNVVISTFPNNSDKALTQIARQGYYYEVTRIDTVTKEMYITNAYMANKPVDKIIVNNYILGA